MYHLRLLTNALEAAPFVVMTFPIFRRLLNEFDSNQILAIAAYQLDEPIGLLLASLPVGENSPQVLSVFVSSAHRGKGIGTRLLRCLEKKLAEKSYTRVEITYNSPQSSQTTLEQILNKLQWHPFGANMVICKGGSKILEAPWLIKYKLRSSCSIVPWLSLNQDDRHALWLRQDKDLHYPNDVSPYVDEDLIEPSNSLGLLYKGEIVGWLLTHRISQEMIRYTSLFIREDIRNLGCSVQLITQALNLHDWESIPYGVTAVKITNNPMMLLLKRRISPYLSTMSETRKSYKILI